MTKELTMMDIMICIYDRGSRDSEKRSRVVIYKLDEVPYEDLVGQLKGGLTADELREEIEFTRPGCIATPDKKPYGMTVIGWAVGRATALKRQKEKLIRKTLVSLTSPDPEEMARQRKIGEMIRQHHAARLEMIARGEPTRVPFGYEFESGKYPPLN